MSVVERYAIWGMCTPRISSTMGADAPVGSVRKGSSGMFARVSTYQGDPGQIDEGLNYARENILPRVKQVDGFEGVYYLVDRESGKALTITLWESEEAMRASEEEANRLRSESAESASATVENVERYEVGISPEQS
jgi:heme-degrading monooxygenase HmoA